MVLHGFSLGFLASLSSMGFSILQFRAGRAEPGFTQV